MYRFALSLLLCLCLISITTNSCRNRFGQKGKSENSEIVQRAHPTNIIQTILYGDSARLEVEKRGDSLFKHYIDLKGRERRNFDGSYTAICTYKEIPNDSLIHSNLFIKEGRFITYFDRKAIAHFCDSIIESDRGHHGNGLFIEEIRSLKERSFKRNWSDINRSSDLSILLLGCDGNIVDSKAPKRTKSILVEFYTTDFSGGENFFVITEANDTLPWFYHNSYMN